MIRVLDGTDLSYVNRRVKPHYPFNILGYFQNILGYLANILGY